MTTWFNSFFCNPSSSLMESVIFMHDYALMFLISVLVMVMFSIISTYFLSYFDLTFFKEEELESIWTFLPFFILILIVIPSLFSLYMSDSCFFCGMTVSVVGHQWYWSYGYKDFSKNIFDSYMLSDNLVLRLLEVDNRLIVPVMVPIRTLMTSADVIHSWTIPTMGVKMDCVPGRLNQLCFIPKRCGVYFGQCSEICGANHSFMPVVLETINFKDFISKIWNGTLSKEN